MAGALVAQATTGGPISQLVGFHVDPLYTSLAAVVVGAVLVYRVNSQDLWRRRH